MRVAKDLLSLFDFAGAPVPAPNAPARSDRAADRPADRPPLTAPGAVQVVPHIAAQMPLPPAMATPSRSPRPAAEIGRADLWHADDLPDDDGPTLATGFAPLDAELPGGGWPQGQLVELLVDAPGLGELSQKVGGKRQKQE